MPTFSRQTDADTADERPGAAGAPKATPDAHTGAVAAPVDPPTAEIRPRRDDTTATDLRPVDLRTADLPPAPKTADRSGPPPAPPTHRTEAERASEVTAADHDRDTVASRPVVTEPVATGPKPRASLLATLGLILGVASALLVLSGPLLGYGIGVAGLALILSLLGIRATGKRHVAGKSDALIGMVLSLAAIVVGVLALTGSLIWLGTDMQPVNSLREWLDAQFANRF
jgi:hypothetical protein